MRLHADDRRSRAEGAPLSESVADNQVQRRTVVQEDRVPRAGVDEPDECVR